jgi:hypothetical protein
MSKAYLNALYEEGTKQDCFNFLCKVDAANDRLRDAMKAASAELKCPAAEFVPAMPAAWEILDRALKED